MNMDTQNIERRDSKKSNKGGVGATGGYKGPNRGVPVGGGGSGGSSNGNGNGGAGEKASEKQRSHSQKSGKPYREIYKPPSLRSTKNRSSNSFNEQDKGKYNDEKGSPEVNSPHSKKGVPMQNSNFTKNNIGMGSNNGNRSGLSSSSSRQQNDPYTNDASSDPHPMNMQNGYSLFGKNDGNGSSGNNGSGSVPSSPLLAQRMQQNAFNIGLANRMLNVNAKEFQFLPIQQQHQQQQQQISNFLREFDPSLFYNATSPILASSGCYPLKQSKSSGNMNLLLQQQQQQQAQVAALQQLQQQLGFSFPFQQQHGDFSNAMNSQSPGVNNGGSAGQFNRLSQSKSSGNVPGGRSKPTVRFDDEEPDFDDVEDFVGGQLGNYLASLKLNGDVSGISAGPHFSRGYPFQQQQQQPSQGQAVPSSPQSVLKSSLQKSRTGFYLNLYGNQQPQLSQTSPTKAMYGFSNSPSGNSNTFQQQGSNYGSKVNASSGPGQQYSSFQGTGSNNIVKRSRSFGPGTHHVPRVSAATLLSASRQAPSSVGHSVYSDFCIMRWPRAVQELVTAAVTGVDRIPARNWIEMVNGIFEAMLCDFRPTKKDRISSSNQSLGITGMTGSTPNKMSGAAASSTMSNEKGSGEMSSAAGDSSGKSQQNGDDDDGDVANACSALSNSQVENNDLAISPDVDDAAEDNDEEEDDEDDDDDTDLTSAAVHIFLYFIQREKDRTVMESLLNTCFASFQRLSSISLSNSSPSPSTKSGKSQLKRLMAQQIGKPSVSRQWSNFLRFLSTLYSQVKLIRRQKQSQQQPGQSMDEMRFSLLALLCDSCLATLRSPQSYTAEMMGCLFTVLTSIGRDMEGTFPLKMKQLLAAVRDALLGIGPYHQQQQQQQHHYPNNSQGSTSTSASSSTRSSSLSPIVQKTLMQLIELHAANWQLPASAVRYYYSSVNSGSGGGGSSNKSMTNANNSNASSSTQKTNNNNYSNSNKSEKHDNHAHASQSTTSSNSVMVASTDSSSSVKSHLNGKNNNEGVGSTNEDKTKVTNTNDDSGNIKNSSNENDAEVGEGKDKGSNGSSGLVEPLELKSKPQNATE